jgi:hypothetical protein
MKIAVLYNLTEKPTTTIPLPDNWGLVVRRFAESYAVHTAGYAHDFYICSSGGALSSASKEAFESVKYNSFVYTGGGWDIGAYQYCAKFLLNYDLVVCFNSQAHISSHNWLRYFVEAFETYGVGVYGTSSSFEVAPHIRTSCIAFSPRLIGQYPLKVRCRYDACVFEHSPKNFSLWALNKGLFVGVVSGSGITPLLGSRDGSNIFRRGSQEDLLIKDRHTIIYDKAGPSEREYLGKLADGIIVNDFKFLSRIDHFTARHTPLEKLRTFFSPKIKRLIRPLRGR